MNTSNLTLSVAAILAEGATRYPELNAITMNGVSTTYRELWDETRAYAGALAQHGISEGDRVAVLIPNVTDFARVYYAILALGATALPLLGKTRKLEVGHTGLTWIPLGGSMLPGAPRPAVNPMVDPQYVRKAIEDLDTLGFKGIELFGQQIEAMEAHGGVGTLLEQHKVPLISAYCGTNLTDPAQRKDAMAKMMDWGKLVKKYGGVKDLPAISAMMDPALVADLYKDGALDWPAK